MNNLSNIAYKDCLYHYGVSIKDGSPGRGSGRYPLGSGKEPYQNKINGFKRSPSVKKWEPKPGDKVIKKGSSVYRVSDKTNETNNGSTYVTYNDIDRNLYKGGYLEQLYKQRGLKWMEVPMYENQYKLKEDLRIPNIETSLRVIDKIVTPEEGMKAVFDNKILQGFDNKYITYAKDNGYSVDEFIKKGHEALYKSIEENWKEYPEERKLYYKSGAMVHPEIRKKVIEELSKDGYNAMSDEYSIGGKGGVVKQGEDPLILFDSDVLKYKKSIEIDYEEGRKAYNKIPKSYMR